MVSFSGQLPQDSRKSGKHAGIAYIKTMTGINSLFEDCHTSLKKCVNVRKTESNVFLKRKIQRP